MLPLNLPPLLINTQRPQGERQPAAPHPQLGAEPVLGVAASQSPHPLESPRFPGDAASFWPESPRTPRGASIPPEKYTVCPGAPSRATELLAPALPLFTNLLPSAACDPERGTAELMLGWAPF